jgi:hypothetical protein
MNDAIKAAEKKLPSGLTWAQAVDLIGDEAVSLWKISGRVAANNRLTDADRYRLADAIVKKSAKPPPTDVEKAHAEYLDRVQNEWKHDKRKKQQTTHVQSEDPDTSEEALRLGPSRRKYLRMNRPSRERSGWSQTRQFISTLVEGSAST